MFNALKLSIYLFWLMDIMDFEFMKQFDTTYPLNGVFWFCVILLTMLVGNTSNEKE